MSSTSSVEGKPHASSFLEYPDQVFEHQEVARVGSSQDMSLQREREVVIQKARNDFEAMCKQLSKKSRVEALYREELTPIINYKPTRELLYVNNGMLAYRVPMFYYGSYTDGFEVIKYISDELILLTSAYERLDIQSKWRGIRLGEQIIKGLNLISVDYGFGECYKEFRVSLQSEIESISEIVDKEKVNLNRSLNSFKGVNEACNLVDLYALPAESYPLNMILEIILERYGIRLRNVVLNKYLKSERVGNIQNDTIPKEELRDIIICIATNVNLLDIMQKYQEILDTKKDFNQLTDIEIDKALSFYRKTSDGRSLIGYFSIPISSKDFTVTENYLKSNPQSTLNGFNQLYETFVLADIESVRMWHDETWCYMPRLEMFDCLQTFFNTPLRSIGQVFHTDRYLSFLTAAATIIAYIEDCKEQNDELSVKINPLIYFIEDITTHCSDIYQQGFMEKYKELWLTLITHLKSVVNDSSYSLKAYYISLFAHPLQNSKQKKKALEVHQLLQGSEFLARKVAYWNRYYLSSKIHLESIERAGFEDIRSGTLFHLPESGKQVLYEINSVIMESGFVCQMALPISIHLSANMERVPVKIIFQGTIGTEESILRDKNPIGPGYGLWKNKGFELIENSLQSIQRKIRRLQPKAKLDIEFVGHSLGGADAQNAASVFLEKVNKKASILTGINSIVVHTFNSAGIPEESAKLFNFSCLQLGLENIKIRHSLVQDDIVEDSGQAKLGHLFPFENKVDLMEISNLGVYHAAANHCFYGHALTKTVVPHKILDQSKDAKAIHAYLIGGTHSWKDLRTHTHDIIERRPSLMIAYSSLSLVSTAFKSVYNMGFSSHHVPSVSLSMLNDEREAVVNIWEAIKKVWEGKQILEEAV